MQRENDKPEDLRTGIPARSRVRNEVDMILAWWGKVLIWREWAFDHAWILDWYFK